jgi:hypothetical protein
MARGPLFQKATTIATHQREIREISTLNVAQELSENLALSNTTHWYGGSEGVPADLLSVIRKLSAQVPIKMDNTSCDGECEARVKVRYARTVSKRFCKPLWSVPFISSTLNVTSRYALHLSILVVGCKIPPFPSPSFLAPT